MAYVFPTHGPLPSSLKNRRPTTRPSVSRAQGDDRAESVTSVGRNRRSDNRGWSHRQDCPECTDRKRGQGPGDPAHRYRQGDGCPPQRDRGDMAGGSRRITRRDGRVRVVMPQHSGDTLHPARDVAPERDAIQDAACRMVPRDIRAPRRAIYGRGRWPRGSACGVGCRDAHGASIAIGENTGLQRILADDRPIAKTAERAVAPGDAPMRP